MQFKQLVWTFIAATLLTFSSVANANMSIQTGIAEVGTTTSHLLKSFSVTFATPFAKVPVVVITPSHNLPKPSGVSDTFAVTITSITQTGFTANIYRVDGGSLWAQPLFANWIAISN